MHKVLARDEMRGRYVAHRKPEEREGGVSPELDELSSTLMGDALDLLAEGEDVNVLLVVEDAERNVASYEFADDGPDALIEAAHQCVRDLARGRGGDDGSIGRALRYAIAYEGAVADELGVFRDAVLLEFGEKGSPSYSAYSLYEGKGLGDRFRWSEPAPAGEVPALI